MTENPNIVPTGNHQLKVKFGDGHWGYFTYFYGPKDDCSTGKTSGRNGSPILTIIKPVTKVKNLISVGFSFNKANKVKM